LYLFEEHAGFVIRVFIFKSGCIWSETGRKEGRKEQHNKGGRFESVDLTALGEEKALPLLLPSTHPKNLM
jgi:hypothetical protein